MYKNFTQSYYIYTVIFHTTNTHCIVFYIYSNINSLEIILYLFILYTKYQLIYSKFVYSVKGATPFYFIYPVLFFIFLVNYHTYYKSIKSMEHILWLRLYYYLAKCLQMVYCHLKSLFISFIYHGDCHIFCVDTNSLNLFFIISKLLIRFYTICLMSYYPLFNLNCQLMFFSKSKPISTYLIYSR